MTGKMKTFASAYTGSLNILFLDDLLDVNWAFQLPGVRSNVIVHIAFRGRGRPLDNHFVVASQFNHDLRPSSDPCLLPDFLGNDHLPPLAYFADVIRHVIESYV